MKKLAQLALLLGLILTAFESVHAALLIEPLAGFDVGKINIKDTTTNKTKGYNLSGGAFGGRLGYQNFGLQLGLDYLAASQNVSSNSHDLKTSEWAGFVGFKFPILLKVYAGYIFSGTGKLGSTDYSGGTGPKLGIGTTVLPFLDINVEYRKVTYDEVKYSGVSKTDTKDNYDAIMLSVSLPFTI